MNFKTCADFGADDGETVTILKRLVAWAYFFGPQFWTAGQPKNICQSNEPGVREVHERRDPEVHQRFRDELVGRKSI